MNIVLFEPGEIHSPLKLHDERAVHITRILHKKTGDSFESGIINGKKGTAVITGITAEKLFFSFTPEAEGKKLYPLRLLVGFPRPIQLKRLLRDAASLGAEEVHLMGTELGEKSYMKSTLVERGAAYASLIEGTVQAKETCVPSLFMHESVRDCCTALEKGTGICLVMDNVNPEFTLSQDIPLRPENPMLPVYIAIGSERGWTDRERAILENEGFIRCGMGTRILRTETAVTAAVSIILSRFGLM